MNIILRLPRDLFNKTMDYYNPLTPSGQIIHFHIKYFKQYRSFELVKYGTLFQNYGYCPVCQFIVLYMGIQGNEDYKLDLLCRFYKHVINIQDTV